MHVTVLGCGYVGLITGIFLASHKHQVLLTDIDPERLAMLHAGQCPLHEPGLQEAMTRSAANWRCAPLQQALQQQTQCYVIAVGTPSKADGSSDLSAVWQLIAQLAPYAQPDTVVVIKSTVPVGATAQIAAYLQHHCPPSSPAAVVHHPEFLREGHAVADCWHPQRIVVGCDREAGFAMMEHWYGPLLARNIPLLRMNWASAELSKYAANGLLAVRLAFLNQLLPLCRAQGANMSDVLQSSALDARIGPYYLRTGLGFGGPCLPKDMLALTTSLAELAAPHDLLANVNLANAHVWQDFVTRFAAFFAADLAGKTVAIWGMAFKPGIDDVRASPALVIMEALLAQGCKLRCFDPMAMASSQRHFGSLPQISYAPTPEACLHGSHGLLILTAWPVFRDSLLAFPKQHGMRYALIMDGWDLLSPTECQALPGLHYAPMGRAPCYSASLPRVFVEGVPTMPSQSAVYPPARPSASPLA